MRRTAVWSAARRAGTVGLLAALAAVLSGSSCAPPQPPRGEPRAAPRATAVGSGLFLDGRPWWPTGLNAYQLATDWGINAGCGAEVDLDAYFSALPDRSLTRFNAFQNLAVNKHTGELDFTTIDRVVAAAERHDQMILPVLAGQDGACDDEVFKQRDWYLGGWTRPGALPLSHRDWVAAAVGRWSGSPVIAAWEPVGEPEPSICSGDDCSLAARTCPADSERVLREWTDEVGRVIRGQDPGRLITAGVIGGDQCGIAGDGYGLLAKSPYVDVLQYHDYDDAAWLPQRLDEVDAPVLVAEVGLRAGSCNPLDGRADRLAARLDGYRTVGAAGAMLWAFVPDPRPDECTFDIGPGDPILAHAAMQPGLG
ncbi:beta-mannosidase [uncultured Dietzia sp.]|uniref:beta-mannosidase n=1 Tax=uncultured Dietzia sp. TaxID=395519 RepID=UPI0025D36403|nr:beta-mannosidase [uncultured Dietzia sp.]